MPSNPWRGSVWWLGSLAITLLGMGLYGPTLNLLLFWDDVPHMQWLDSQQGLSYWTSSAGFPFYRPATFTIWDLLHQIYGYHNPTALHALSVLLHVANSLLVGWFAARLSGLARAGVWAGLLFVAFPFSYQAVIPTAAHFHLWMVFGVLAGGWLLLLWLENNWVCYLIGGWILVFWGVFSHENGVLAPFLIGGMLLIDLRQRSRNWRGIPRRRLLVAVGPVIVFAGLYGLVWLLIPKGNEASGLQLAAFDAKLAQTFQAVSFPLAAALRAWIDPDEGTSLAWVSGGAVAMLLVAWFFWGHCHRAVMQSPLWLGLFGLLWIPLVMLPSWTLLDVNYLLGSPRLHYLAAVGIAWLLGGLASMPFGDDVRWSWPVGGGLIAASLVVAMPFVSTRVAQHEDINRIYAGTGDLASRYWSDEANTFLLVNGPAYLAPADPTFLLGAEGATFLPDFINLGDWLRLNRYIGAGQADNRRAGDIIPASDDIFAVTHPALDRTTVNEYAQVAVVVRSHDDVNVILAGRQGFDAPAVDVPAGDFGNGVILERGILTQDRLPGMQAYRLELVWRVDETLPAHATVFAHLICDSQLVAQADGPPLGRVYPFSLWAAGERWHDFRYMSAASHEQSCLRAFVGLYDPATGDRLPVRTPSGDSADGVWIDLATDD